MIRDLRNYLAGQVVGITRDEALLDELLKCAFCRVALQRDCIDTSSASPEEIHELYETRFYNLRQELYLLDLGQDLQLGPSHIHHVDALLSKLDLLDPDRDVIADIYQAFVGNAFRGQEGQFFTPPTAIKALVAMVAPAPGDKVLDPACGAGGFLLEAARYTRTDRSDMSELRGIDKDGYLVKLARIHLALRFGGNPSIVCTDSLSSLEDLAATTGYPPQDQDVVLTNPPFGSKIVAVAKDRRHEFKLGHRWKRAANNGHYEQLPTLAANPSPQVLFLERCVDLLRSGGRLGIVLPESTLSSAGHRGMVQYMLERLTPLAIVGMPEALFKTSGKGGTHAKVCLVVAEKRRPEPNHRVFMAEAEWCGHDSRGLPIARDDLPEIVANYKQFRSGGSRRATRKAFSVRLDDLRQQVLAPRYYDPSIKRQLGKLAKSHDRILLGDLISDGRMEIRTGDEVGKLAYGSGAIPFVRTSDLSNWEIKVDPKHCVSDDIYNELSRRQDVAEGDILMVKDGTYLIGTCAMVTRHDVRIVYQSHLYKLRLQDTELFDRFLLLAALSSPPVKSQIRAFSFTQDIIDSLGDRISEVVVPIPRSQTKRQEISTLVKRVVADRVEARELAREASLEIAQNGAKVTGDH
jgi:type I restriction enzyme M protein